MLKHRIKSFCNLIDGYPFKSSQYVDYGVQILRISNINNGEIVDKNSRFYPKEKLKDYEKSIAQENDVLVTLTGNVGHVGIIRKEHLPAAINQRVVGLRNSSSLLYTKYLYYKLNTKAFEQYCEVNAQGTAQLNLSILKMLNYRIDLPKYRIQENISNFLDDKTAKIDELIKMQETAIERLEEYKQSVITETVTKGLKPDAEMKDSEIYNIGQIPNHWRIVKLQRMMRVQNGKPCVWVEEGFPVYGSGGIFGYTSDFLYDAPSVLLGRKGTIDKPNFVNEPFWTVDTSFYTVISEGNHPKFCYYIAKSIIDYKLYVYGSAVPSMTQSILHNVYIVKPPYDEQVLISDYLDKKTDEFNQLIQIKKDKIDRLNEYKKSLIYEAVTGKIEVM